MKQLNPNLKRLIKILNDGNYHTGSALGEKLNITRSAVWKFMHQLENYGIAIKSDKKQGYCLKQPIILLNASAIKKHLKIKPCNLKIFNSIPSTIDYLKTCTAKSPQICLAEQQTAGKGRLGRTFHSPFGLNIYLSCLWNFNKDISELSGLSLVTSLATIKTLTNYTKNLKIKWPNDILYNQQKLAGILIEISAESHVTSKAIISIGLNVNMTQASITQNWTSLINILNQPQDRNQIIGQLINQLFHDLKQFETSSFGPFLSEWQKHDYLKNKPIKLLHGQQPISGIAAGINDQGHLLLKHKDGSIGAYSSGDTIIHK